MGRVLPVLCLCLSFCSSIPAQVKPGTTPKPKSPESAAEARESSNSAPAKLPVRRVVLYKNGVGYFEHLGHVRGSQGVHIDFTSAQLNDVLKSLTVLDLSGGRITGVDYNSEAPLARRLATLRLALGERPTTAVRLMDENNGVIAQTTTESNGQYSFSGVSTGNYRVEVERPGFRKNVIASLNVAPGENQFNSQLQVGSSTETVTVSAEATTVQTSSMLAGSSKLHGVANRPHVDSLAINGRNYGNFAALQPGVAGPSVANLEEARELSTAVASGQELGDLFEYKLKDRVTLKKNQSALVPIAQTEIDAEKVSLWSGITGSGRPLRGLWLKNTSPLTLDGGSFSVLENEVFAGEGLTDPIKPGERRLISYATDLGLLVEASKNSQPQHVTRVRISKGVLTQVSELHERTLYLARNQDASTRTLVIEHPARVDWQLAKGAKEPEEKAPGVYRFRVEVSSKASASLPVEEVRTLSTNFELANLNEEQIAVFVKQGTITGEMAEALKKITVQKAVVAKLEEEMENRQKDIDRIVEDQGRLRENMKALRGTAEEKALLQRYTKQLDGQETQLDALRKKIRDTEAQRDKANGELEKMIEGLQIEASV